MLNFTVVAGTDRELGGAQARCAPLAHHPGKRGRTTNRGPRKIGSVGAA